MKPNAVVAQSGGPSPVINASLLGVLDGCRDFPDRIGEVYAAWHGVEGVLQEELIPMSGQDRAELELLRTTTSAGAIGTCRYKLTVGQEEDFERILEVMRAHQVGYFFYIGGNDSMDTLLRVSHSPYQVRFDKMPLEEVAASSRQLPPHWITPDGLDVTDDFVQYARPLIGEGWPEIPLERGLQRFARLQISFVDKMLPEYVPVRFRSG